MGGVAGQLYFDNYSPVGDITVIATCFVILVLIFTSYVNKCQYADDHHRNHYNSAY